MGKQLLWFIMPVGCAQAADVRFGAFYGLTALEVTIGPDDNITFLSLLNTHLVVGMGCLVNSRKFHIAGAHFLC